jgi:hypothetical protein
LRRTFCRRSSGGIPWKKAFASASVTGYVEARTRHKSLPEDALETLAEETERRLLCTDC